MIRTEKEAWTAVADVLELLRAMPFRQTAYMGAYRNPKRQQCPGLCAVVLCMRQDFAISQNVATKMAYRIRKELFLTTNPYTVHGTPCFLFRPYAWQVRAKLARRFAEECE